MKARKLFRVMAPVLLGVVVTVALLMVMPVSSIWADGPGETCEVIQPGGEGKDAYIKEDDAGKNEGGKNELKVKTESGKNKDNRALLEFDLSNLPKGASVITATLSLYVKDVKHGDVTINAHQVTQAWVEGGVTWNTYDGTNTWAIAGGDYDASNLDSTFLAKDTKNVWASWDVTGAADDWLNPATNFGVILESPVTTPKSEAKFKSSDDGKASERPKLEVCYIPPPLTVEPDNEQQANPGEVVSYNHIIANNSGATDTVTVTATSDQGWSLHLWYDQDGDGAQDPGEPDLTSGDNVGISASATYTLGVEVSVPVGATEGTEDQTVITVTSGNDPSESATATDTTQVRIIKVDGLLDSSYSFLQHFDKSGSGNDALAPGNLYGYEGTDTCYWAFVVDRAFNDNVYDDNKGSDYLKLDGWNNHDYGKLKGSDRGIFDVSEPGNSSNLYFDDLTLDYLDEGGAGGWSSGFTGRDGSDTAYLSQGLAAATSLEWNLEQSGWSDLTISPPYDWNNTHDPGWEWNMIYEFSIPKSEMGGQCGDVVQSGAHNSPSKEEQEQCAGKIGDYVWHDVNINGLQDDGGPSAGIANVTVNLYDGTTLIRTTQTAPSGYYIFNNLEAGDYYVEFVLPNDDYEFSPQDRGGDDELDSDADPTTGKTITTTLELGNMIDLTLDAGLHLCSIGDRVWNDESWNGDQSGTEPGLNGVYVYLFADTGITPTCAITETGYVTHTVTISGTSQTPDGFPDGIYLFDMESLGLGEGDYWVCVDEDTLPTGQWTLTTGSNPQQVTYAGTDDFSIDFGYAAKVDLALTKTLDTTSYGSGDLVTFSITVTNEGYVDATGVQIIDFHWTTDTIEYHSTDNGGTYDDVSKTVIWDLPDVGDGVGNLPAGASATVHITFTLMTNDGNFLNDAEIYACDQEDVDSTPNNGWDGLLEDDIDEDGGSVQPTAVTLSSFAAQSSTGNAVRPLWLGLAGLVLAAGSLFWAKRRAG